MLKTNTITTILALKGSGKSKLTEFLFLQNPKSCIIFDPNETLGGFKNRVFVAYNEANPFKTFRIIKRILYKYKDSKVDIVITQCFNSEILLNLIWQELTRICIVIDEVDMYYSASISKESIFFHYINRGRHKEIDIICNARRPAKVPRDLTSQSDYIFLGFVGREPLDLRYYKEVFMNLDKLPKERFKWVVFDTINQNYLNFEIPKDDYQILQRGYYRR